MIEISTTTIALIVGGISILGSIFGIFFYFQKPQIALEKRVSTLEDNYKFVMKEMESIRATHLETNGALQKDLKEMTTSVNNLSISVTELKTIINERIPKGSPNLTPPGK